MAENGKQQQQLVAVEDVKNFIASSVVASVAAAVIAHQLLESCEARVPLWRRITLLPWRLYYAVADAAGALKKKAVEWLRRKICCSDDCWCDEYDC